MRCACIDIGSNTTRLLVAEHGPGEVVLRDVAADRAFTRLAADRGADGSLSPERIVLVAEVVATQATLAREAGATALRAVATAAVRDAPNADALCAAVLARSGVVVEVIDGDEEARLAFAGATGLLGTPPGPDERLGVVDVGGGSTELVCGTTRDGVGWSRSFRIGSGVLTERHVRGACPSAAELAALRADVAQAFSALDPPAVRAAHAVGGSATSLGRLTGGELHPASLDRALEALCSGPVAVVAERLGLHPDRVRMLPAGIVVLGEAARALGVPLRIASGGLREGVILAMASG
ncbi:MAG: Ppx/GppA phosphatase [Solirubrobacterales bacterium]|jgi:exopolyphosphatase/guanosine-5'-triphosphate,3'-diphosphate pyrophosphatase|nr:Ppx/GppA phosphatase [Solirubrobacterales bacterium]